MDYQPHIGKTVIETLTLGMYEDARFIYREYVQNAADQIDVAVEEGILENNEEGEINITIDQENRLISVQDNATGIAKQDVARFLGDVANSQKDREKQKGFRGIGRLGGLGYCDKLVFETSYQGESVKSGITLDAALLKKILANKADTSDAATVISVITTIDSTQPETEEAHYFKVTLFDVSEDAENLLNQESVREYLSMTAPVPFTPGFEWRKKISDYFRLTYVALDEYDIRLNINNEKLYKPYRSTYLKNDDKDNPFADLLDVDLFHHTNENGEIICIGWIGITNKLNYQLPKDYVEAGVRMRRGNIGIGNRYTLSRLFPQYRQNQNYIGEVYAIGAGFTPNARRDYFNDSPTVTEIENYLKKYFASLGALTEASSQIHNRLKNIKKYRTEVEIFKQESESGHLTEQEIAYKKENIDKLKKTAIKSAKTLENLKKKAENNYRLSLVYDDIIGEEDIAIDQTTFDTGWAPKPFEVLLPQLSSQEQTIVREILAIVSDSLSADKAGEIIRKVVEKYS